MKIKKRTTTMIAVSLKPELIEWVRNTAKKNHRPYSRQIGMLIEKEIAAEMNREYAARGK